MSPHFPPDASAATHRVRLVAPYLSSWGWAPTVVTVDAQDYEGELDPTLLSTVPANLRVVRARAWSPRRTRRLGFGDLGLRAFRGLKRACEALLARERFDLLFITIYPTYPALLGPAMKERFGVRFVLDYQDPWVGSWGRTVGGGAGGRADVRSRLSRALASALEPRVIKHADGITAVSRATWDAVARRHPDLRSLPFLELPIGGDARDFETLARLNVAPPYAKVSGRVDVCYVGTLLPTGLETLAAVLRAVARLRDEDPAVYARLRLHFIGTSNQSATGQTPRVIPVARALGIAEAVTEIPERMPYFSALAALAHADAILMMGTSEPHYTASKLYPGLLARRPILAVYHAASTVVPTLQRAVRHPVARVVTYDDHERAAARVDAIRTELGALVAEPVYDARAVDLDAVAEYGAPVVAGRLAGFFDALVGARAAA